ncbi:helix-turn-helix domain-containing protein [Paenibacillus gansuensis]|uniref:Helix-turn-helix domain-containing protein n=1 Tax=Paenibacillus gansuensis TaxID=306542 RepID=A0ABW5PFA5_9BACL
MTGLFARRPVFAGAKAFFSEPGECYHFPLHRHEDVMELLFIAEGYSDYSIDGIHYRGGPGDIVLFHPGIWHEERSRKDTSFTFYYAGFHSLQLHGLPMYHLYSPEVREHPVFSAGPHAENMKSLFESLCQEVEEGWNEHLSGANAWLELIILEAHRARSYPQARAGRTSPVTAVAQARRLMEERYDEPLTIRKLADAAFLSESYFSHLFTSQYGISPIRFLIKQRLAAAKRYLATTSLPIEEIAQRVGYSSSTAFFNLFKKEEDCTPGDYRKKHRITQMESNKEHEA